jgi:rhomboid protease GluP
MPYVTLGIIAITSIISVVAFTSPPGGLLDLLALDKVGVANGEYWRLFTVTLVHGSYLHLFFNMYALYLAGALTERLYGPALFLPVYLLAAAAGSVGSYLFAGDVPSVGASGAVFGLFGLLLAASWTYHPVLDRRNQMILGQIGGLIVLNLIIGFGFNGIGGNIDNFAHLGGLLAGLWLGFLLKPGNVATTSSFWQRPGGVGASTAAGSVTPNGLRVLGVLALVVAIAVGVSVGTQERKRAASSNEVSTAAWMVGRPARMETVESELTEVAPGLAANVRRSRPERGS